MKRKIKQIVADLFGRYIERASHKSSEKREKQLLNSHGTVYSTVNEHAWLKYWNPLVKCRSVWAYRLYSRYCGETKFIVSQPIADILNRSLNPEEFIPFYSDKNIFDKVLPKGVLPKTILRVIDGVLMDSDYNILTGLTDDKLNDMLHSYTRVVIKPTIGSSSGRGVLFFDLWDKKSEKLTISFIKSIGKDLIIQEALQQSKFMLQFNPTSINTIRIATYKSPYSGKVDILSAVIRMGAPGSSVDNLHQEGHMIRINEETGALSKECYDANGVASSMHGTIDFSQQSFVVPNWEEIKEFAYLIARAVPHMKLLQLDIAIDSHGNPRILEYNLNGFSMWIAQFTGTPAFGKYTDEIRRYALSKKRSIKVIQTLH